MRNILAENDVLNQELLVAKKVRIEDAGKIEKITQPMKGARVELLN